MRFVLFAATLVAGSLLTLAPATAPAATSATMPTCAAGDPVVWENSKSKVYHLQGDSYYGKTKSGAYACQSAANSAGYHAAGSKSGGATAPAAMTSSAPDASASAAASPGAMMNGTHRPHRHRHSASATPSPAPVPAAT